MAAFMPFNYREPPYPGQKQPMPKLTEDEAPLASSLSRYPAGFAFAITLLLLILGSASEAAEQQAKLARSSVATAVLALDAYLKGAVSSAYVQRTLDAMMAPLSDAARGQGDASTVDGSEAASPAKQALDVIDRAQAAVKADDYISITQARSVLISIADKRASTTAQRP
jgi:hypothetical protein